MADGSLYFTGVSIKRRTGSVSTASDIAGTWVVWWITPTI
jgi:hypothetical protein